MNLKHSWLIVVFFVSSLLFSQKFPFLETPVKSIDKGEKTFITSFLLDQFTFGSVNYVLSKDDFLQGKDVKSSFPTLSSYIESFKDSLKIAKNLEDSVNAYLKLFSLHRAAGNYSKADSISVLLSFRLNGELSLYSQGLSSASRVLTMAAYWSEICNNDPYGAYYFYSQAMAKDSLDSLAFYGLYQLFSQAGLYEKVDSMFFVAARRFPKLDLFEYVPLLVYSLYNTVVSQVSILDKERKLCLSQIIQIEVLSRLEKNKDVRHQMLGSLSKLLLYIMRYIPDLSGKDLRVKASPCDRDSLQFLKSKLLKIEKTNAGVVFPFVVQESLGWLYLMINKADSALFWLAKAEKGLDPYGIYFSSKMYNIKMLQSYIYLKAKKDTTRAISVLEDIQAKKDKMGFYPDNLLLLAQLYIGKKQYDKAISNIDKYLTLPLPKTDAMLLKAVALYLKKKPAESFAIIDELLKQPDAASNDKPYVVGALLYLLDGNTSKAYQYLLSGYAIQPQNETFLYLGSRYFKPRAN